MKLLLLITIFLLFSGLALAEEITGNLTIGAHENTTLVIIVTEVPETNTGYRIEISPLNQTINLNKSFNFTLTVYDSFNQIKTNFTESNFTVWIYSPDTESKFYVKNETVDKLTITPSGNFYNVTINALNTFVGGEMDVYFKVKDYLNKTGENHTSVSINESYIHFWWSDAPSKIYLGEKDTWTYYIKNYGNKTATVNASINIDKCLAIDTTTVSPSAYSSSVNKTHIFYNKTFIPGASEKFSFSVVAENLSTYCNYTIVLSGGKYWLDGNISTSQTISDYVTISNQQTANNATQNSETNQTYGKDFDFAYVPSKVSIVEGENAEFFISLNTTENKTVKNVTLTLALNSSLYKINPVHQDVVPGKRAIFTVNISLPSDYQIGSEAIAVSAKTNDT